MKEPSLSEKVKVLEAGTQIDSVRLRSLEIHFTLLATLIHRNVPPEVGKELDMIMQSFLGQAKKRGHDIDKSIEMLMRTAQAASQPAQETNE